jgi:hypothetical protein
MVLLPHGNGGAAVGVEAAAAFPLGTTCDRPGSCDLALRGVAPVAEDRAWWRKRQRTRGFPRSGDQERLEAAQ